MRTLFVATSNVGKLRDFAIAAAQAGAEWMITTLPGLDGIAPPEETGATFDENARLKALYYAEHAPGALVMADDSGLEVDALGGAPGVYSARYAELSGCLEGPADTRNNSCLLAALADVPGPRTARYRCVLACARDGAIMCTAGGAVEGEILFAPRGTEGFGYDPLFWLPPLGKSMAELDRETRLGLSHRGAALRRLVPQLAAIS